MHVLRSQGLSPDNMNSAFVPCTLYAQYGTEAQCHKLAMVVGELLTALVTSLVFTSVHRNFFHPFLSCVTWWCNGQNVGLATLKFDSRSLPFRF